MGAYAQAVLQKAADHRDKHIRSVQEYFVVRREAIGARPAFVLIELDMNLPDEAVHHPVIKEMTILAIDMIILDNVRCVSFYHSVELIGPAPAIGCRFIQRRASARRRQPQYCHRHHAPIQDRHPGCHELGSWLPQGARGKVHAFL